MSQAQEIQLQIRGTPEHESGHAENGGGSKAADRRQLAGSSIRWWLMVMVDMFIVLCGQTIATLLGRLYYNSGGSSIWMATLTQSGGSPLIAILLLLTPPDSADAGPQPPASKMLPIYLGLGILIGFDNLMYSYALLYLPVSTFALVAATQLGFNSITSRLINKQRFTALIANSVVVLTFSATLLGVGSSSDGTSSNLPPGKYTLGFILTLSASAVFALILSLLEVTFEKVIGTRTFRWVLRVQLYTGLVASAVTVCGLFVSGEWRTIPGEMAAYKDGRARYVATLVGTAVSWQAMAVANLRLITRVSSLFANVTGTVALPLVPVFAVVLFGDKMTGIKAVAMLMAVWGFLSYVYQHFLDGRRAAMGKDGAAECCVCSARAGGEAVLHA
ncbi:probable purine permease 11 isoform X1 [Lolium rigidum]|uniref:probable purine permease 11 isoform X1 n=2 Tax=Lolium rigidum TaxID=89674 RepID=UPI001F5C2050|nr:probable purine permease 11 isoform X1 [Lolium rigidum]